MFGIALNKMKSSIIACVSILTLSACLQDAPLLQKQIDAAGTKKPIKTVGVEQLLDVDGHWNLVEQSKSYDPAEAHLRARERVNIKRRSKKSNLSAHFKPDAKSGQDGKLRVLRLEPQGAVVGEGVGSDYEVAASSVTKPNSMLAEKKLIKAISEFLRSDESRGHGFVNGSIIIPPAVPDRKKARGLLLPVSDIVIPKIKPIKRDSSKVKVNVFALKGGDASNIIIPKVKPDIKPVLLVKAKSSASSISDKLDDKKLGNPSIVNNLRAGLYSGNVRVVIEVSYTTKYKVAIDSLRNVFRVKMENTNWAISPQGSLSGSDLLGTYIARDQKDGSVLLEMRLKDKAEIVKTMVLRPSAGFAYRLVIDLKAL